MKVCLMHTDRDFNLQGELPANQEALVQDLELNPLFNAMARGDDFLLEVARVAVLSSLTDTDTILYRQNILQDCLNNSTIVRTVYDLTVETMATRKKLYFGIFSRYPDAILHGSLEMLELFMDSLAQLRRIADEHAREFRSAGFTAFWAMIEEGLSDEYFTTIRHHFRELRFRDGVLISAGLGEGNKGTNHVLRRAPVKPEGWLARVLTRRPPTYTFSISDRDESGARALSELRDRGLNLVADAAARSADHILGFFNVLRTELAFYVGCLNLRDQLAEKGGPVCMPVPFAARERRRSCQGLYDVSLALSLAGPVVDNHLAADGKDVVVITGANQGGKSSFLRAAGLAQLMTQCGMFVAARSFSVNVCEGIFTHYRREEDPTMRSGKLDEELARMSWIVDRLRPDSLILFNESFAATNEREGSEIAGQVIYALLEKRIMVFFVTHLYEFAHGLFEREMGNAVFLRAERKDDGERSFKMIEGEPWQTSFGEDLYARVFGGPGGA